jgi:hypothetical protein
MQDGLEVNPLLGAVFECHRDCVRSDDFEPCDAMYGVVMAI